MIRNVSVRCFLLVSVGLLWLSACSDSHTSDALVVAARDGNVAGVRAAIAAGANVNACASWEGCDTALALAAVNGHLDVVKILVDNGALLNNRSPTPLYIAADFGHLDVVKYLQSKGGSLGRDDAALRSLRDKLLKRNERELYLVLFESSRSAI
jgi:ankyrin repeat protein